MVYILNLLLLVVSVNSPGINFTLSNIIYYGQEDGGPNACFIVEPISTNLILGLERKKMCSIMLVLLLHAKATYFFSGPFQTLVSFSWRSSCLT